MCRVRRRRGKGGSLRRGRVLLVRSMLSMFFPQDFDCGIPIEFPILTSRQSIKPPPILTCISQLYAPYAIKSSLPRQRRRTRLPPHASPNALAPLNGRPYNRSLPITRNVREITKHVSGVEDASGAAEGWWWRRWW